MKFLRHSECELSNESKLFTITEKLKTEIIDRQIYEELSFVKMLLMQGALFRNDKADVTKYIFIRSITTWCSPSIRQDTMSFGESQHLAPTKVTCI